MSATTTATLKLPDGVVWLASYPKSGNTWMRILLSNLLTGPTEPVDINRLPVSDRAHSREIFEATALVDSDLLLAAEIERLRPSVHDAWAGARGGCDFVRTHDAWRLLADGKPLLGGMARAALYLARDPRDVAVSLAFHLGVPIARAVTMLGESEARWGGDPFLLPVRLGHWSDHVAGWLDQREVPVHLIRYEDLRHDTVAVFRRALDFLGADCDPDSIDRAVRHADFSELQRQERRAGFRERLDGQQQFFRRGEAGDWRRHLDGAQSQAIATSHSATMARLGYT